LFIDYLDYSVDCYGYINTFYYVVDLKSQYTLDDSLAFNRTVINKVFFDYEFISFCKDSFGFVYNNN
jgi:hypothetical protein